MANPMYGQNKADDILDSQERWASFNIDNGAGAAITNTAHTAGLHGFAWKNPEGEDIIVTGFYLDVTTAATGTPTIDAGVAADSTTGSDNLLDAAPVGAAVIVQSSVGLGGGTNGTGAAKMTSTQYITGDGSASLAGMVAVAYVKYFIPSKV